MPLSYCNCEFKLLILPPFYFCPLVFFYTVRVWVLYDQRENERKAGVFLVFSPFGVFFFSLDPKKKKKNYLMSYFRPIRVSFTLRYTNYIWYKSVNLSNPADGFLKGLCFSVQLVSSLLTVTQYCLLYFYICPVAFKALEI